MHDFYLWQSISTLWYCYFYLSRRYEYFFHLCTSATVPWLLLSVWCIQFVLRAYVAHIKCHNTACCTDITACFTASHPEVQLRKVLKEEKAARKKHIAKPWSCLAWLSCKIREMMHFNMVCFNWITVEQNGFSGGACVTVMFVWPLQCYEYLEWETVQKCVFCTASICTETTKTQSCWRQISEAEGNCEGRNFTAPSTVAAESR